MENIRNTEEYNWADVWAYLSERGWKSKAGAGLQIEYDYFNANVCF